MQVETKYQQFWSLCFPTVGHINPYSLSLLTFWIRDHITWNFLLLVLQSLSLINIYMPAECDCNRSYPGREQFTYKVHLAFFHRLHFSTRQIHTLPTWHQWLKYCDCLRVSCYHIFLYSVMCVHPFLLNEVISSEPYLEDTLEMWRTGRKENE